MKPAPKPKDCGSISEIRDAIDKIDMEIIQLFTLRHDYVKEIVKFKSGDEESIVASERKELVFKQRKAWALEQGLDGEMIEEIFRLLIKRNIQIQFDIQKTNTK